MAINPECFDLLTKHTITKPEAVPAPIVKATVDFASLCHSAGICSCLVPSHCSCSDVKACCRTTTVGKKTCAKLNRLRHIELCQRDECELCRLVPADADVYTVQLRSYPTRNVCWKETSKPSRHLSFGRR